MSIEEAAKGLKKAMKGFGTDEKKIILILCNHKNAERQEIKTMYLSMYGKHLEDDLKSEIGGDFLKGVKTMLRPTADVEAEYIHKAIRGLGTDESALIKGLCTKTGSEIKLLSEAYTRMYKKDLGKELAGEQGGDFGRVLQAIATGNREESYDVDADLAKKEAEELYEAGKGKIFGTDESEFIRIFCRRSFHQLNATFWEYNAMAKTPIEKSIKSETGGNFEKALLTIAASAQNRPKYFAGLIHDAMDGIGTEDEDLIRLIVTRFEIDLNEIEVEYQKKYGKKLTSAVKSETSGDYEKLLVTLLEKE